MILKMVRKVSGVCVYRVILQVKVRQQRHVEDCFSPDATVTVRISQAGQGIQPATAAKHTDKCSP